MYMVLRLYDDCTSGTEKTNDFLSALQACEIYLEDPTCMGVKIWQTDNGKILLDYWR